MSYYDNFELLIKNNFSILKTLFHVNENSLHIIDNNTRIIKRNFQISRLFDCIPFLKTILEDIFKNYMIIDLSITEKFNKLNNEFIYKLKLYKDDLKNIRGYLKLSLDNFNKNKINVSMYYKKKSNNNNNIINIDFNNINNITEEIIFQSISNYYKSTFLENDLKPLIKNISHHFFELNIS